MTGRISWGTGITLVYALFAGGTTAFTVYAMRQPVDLVNDNYYEQSLAEDARIAAVQNVDALGPAFSAAASDDGHAVTVQWPAALASSVAGTVTFYRPADASADRTTPLRPDDQGRQTLSLASFAPGRWLVKIAWSAGGRDYYTEVPVMVR